MASFITHPTNYLFSHSSIFFIYFVRRIRVTRVAKLPWFLSTCETKAQSPLFAFFSGIFRFSTMAGGKKLTKEDELLLQNYSRNVSTKSNVLFYANALIVSAIPLCKWRFLCVFHESLRTRRHNKVSCSIWFQGFFGEFIKWILIHLEFYLL